MSFGTLTIGAPHVSGIGTSHGLSPHLVAAMPCLRHKPRGIAVSRGAMCVTHLFPKQKHRRCEKLFDRARVRSFFRPTGGVDLTFDTRIVIPL